MKGEQWVWLTDDPETWPDVPGDSHYWVWAERNRDYAEDVEGYPVVNLNDGYSHDPIVTTGYPVALEDEFYRPTGEWNRRHMWESTEYYLHMDLGCPEGLNVLAWKRIERVPRPAPPEPQP